MGEFKTIEDIPEKLEDNSVIIYSNGVLKQIVMPDYSDLTLKASEGKVVYASCTLKNKW